MPLGLAAAAADDRVLLAWNRELLSRTADGGRTWTRLILGAEQNVVNHVAWVPGGSTLLATTSAGLFRSTDGGETFRDLGSVPFLSALVVDPVDPETLYAAYSSGEVARSTDGGRTWTNTQAFCFDDCSLLVDSGRLYAGSNAGLQVSQDRGDTWRSISDELPGFEVHVAVDRAHEPRARQRRGHSNHTSRDARPG